MRECWVYNCGLLNYQAAWDWQKKLQQERIADRGVNDVLILLEHPPVYTLGTGASLEFVNFDYTGSQSEIHRIDRGGEVTYHCPGQIVGYPILNLRYYRQDLHWYLRQLEEVIIRVLSFYNLEGKRIEGLTGVWVEGQKVAAIGIKVSKWITLHGFALNVCPDLSGFERIVPCGIRDRGVASMAQFIPNIEPLLVRSQIMQAFGDVFGVTTILQPEEFMCRGGFASQSIVNHQE